MNDALDRHAQLVAALMSGEALAAPPAERTLIETHISSLVLAGDTVYKLHKPLALDFLDFSTPELRRADSLEELRLNRRTAPQIYLEVLPIVGTPQAPLIGSAGDAGDAERAFDWVLRMRRFEQSALLDAMAREGRLTAAHIDALAERVAAFHAGLPPAPPLPGHARGQADAVRAWALANLDALRADASGAAQAERIAALRVWTDREWMRLAPLMRERERQGFVRDCHGDLHLGNIVLLEGVPLPFDCIEFDAEMRRIDVVCDIAFTFMDLLRHGLPVLAWRFASGYAEHGGDYAGFALLHFFAVYRAAVRARVALMRAQQLAGAARADLDGAIEHNLALAERLAQAAGAQAPLLVLASGVSGSGKSTVARLLAQHAQAVRVRSDVERKRLFALAPEARPAPEALATLYGPDATRRTYDKLYEIARGLLAAGISTVVDAAALRRSERDALRDLAASAGARFVLLECTAPEPVLRARIARRLSEEQDASDADLAVLDLQLRVREPIAPAEMAVEFDTDTSLAELARRCEALAAQWTATTTHGST